jgi:membrane protease YdiL (CAAX protease family)
VKRTGWRVWKPFSYSPYLYSLRFPFYALGFLTEVSGHYVLYTIYIAGSIIQTKCNGRSLAEIGLTRKGLLPSLGDSILLVVAAFVARFIVADLELSPDANSLGAVIYNLFYSSLSGFGQEILFRGLILFSFDRWKGWKVALAVSTVLFGLIHLQRYQSVSGLFLISMVGALWGWIALKTKNIVGTAIAHSLFNYLFAFLFVS